MRTKRLTKDDKILITESFKKIYELSDSIKEVIDTLQDIADEEIFEYCTQLRRLNKDLRIEAIHSKCDICEDYSITGFESQES